MASAGSALATGTANNAITSTDDEWYVSTSGTSGNTGAEGSPWSLTYAAAGAGGQISSGDTVWIGGGTYSQNVTFAVAGVTFRGAPGGLPVIDGDLGATQQVTLRDLHQTDSSTDRIAARNGNSILASSSLINCSFLDASGIFAQGSTLIHGCITLNQGIQLDESDRGHYHSCYVQNGTGNQAVISKNIFGPGYGYGYHCYTEGGVINDFLWEGNAVALSGLLANQSGAFPNTRYSSLIGGLQPAHRHVVRRHYGYDNTLQLHYSAVGHTYLTIDGTRIDVGEITGTGQWSPFTETTPIADTPGTDAIYLEENEYEVGRANIVVFNPSLASTVAVNLSSVLTNGDPYYIYDGWNPLGSVLTSGTYSGANVTITMPTVYAVPVGGWRWGSAPTRSKAFGAFVVRKVSSWVAPPTEFTV